MKLRLFVYYYKIDNKILGGIKKALNMENALKQIIEFNDNVEGYKNNYEILNIFEVEIKGKKFKPIKL